MRLSEEQLGTYREKGYLLVRDAVPVAPIAGFMEYVASVVELELEKQGMPYEKGEVLHQALIRLKREKPWSSSWIYQTVNTSWALHKFFVQVSLEAAVMQLLGIGDPRHLGIVSPAFRFDIPGDTRNVRTWHQDSNYFLEAEKGEDALVIWLPLNPAFAENGSVIMAEGSHREGRLERLHEKEAELKSEQFTTPEDYVKRFPHTTISANPGDVAFINMDLIHASGTNVTPDNVRYTAQIRFTNSSVPEYRPVFLRAEYPEYRR